MKKAILPLLLLSVLAFVGCQTVPKSVPTNLTPAEYFQDAQQESSAHDNYNAALLYYQTFIDRYPKDKSRIAEAQYEIAFLHYKKGQLQQARSLFQKLVDEYKQKGADALPRWPLVLSNKLIIIIDNDLKKKQQQ